MIRDGEKLYIGTNNVPNKDLCTCEHLKVDFDFGVPYDHEDSIKPKCSMLKESFLFIFKVKKKCSFFSDKNFHSCNFYTPSLTKGTIC